MSSKTTAIRVENFGKKYRIGKNYSKASSWTGKLVNTLALPIPMVI
jgi:hypothetical protein